MGYVRFVEEEDTAGIRGALFLTSGNGDPLEFSFTRVDVHDSVLWRAGDTRRQAISSLVKALFEATKLNPVVVLGLAEEIPLQVFVEDIQSQTPVCLFINSIDLSQEGGIGSEAMSTTQPAVITWVTEEPPRDSEPFRVVDALIGKQALPELFERAALGLIEAYGDG